MKKAFLIILLCGGLIFISYLYIAISGFNEWFKDNSTDPANLIYFKLRMFRNGIIFSLLINIILIIFSFMQNDKKLIFCNVAIFVILIFSLLISNMFIKDLKKELIIFLSIISYISCLLGIIQFFLKKVSKDE